MIFANDYKGACDSEVLNAAISNKGEDGIVVIERRRSDTDPERDFWLIDSAILLPSNTTVVLKDCKIKLSDRARDNFFRTANCGFGIEHPEPVRNIHIRGEGLCILEGADHPRATGDGGKILKCPCPHLPEDICRVAEYVPAERRARGEITFADVHSYSYGTDAGRDDESQYGDWRGIGILFACAEDFSISGVRIVESHGWGISLEACSKGSIERIEFDARMHKTIDGMEMNLENEDGIDIRNGCHDLVISDIIGSTGDDVVALTAIANPCINYKPGGSLRSTHVMHNDFERRDPDIHDIVIRNVRAHSYLCYTLRLLAVGIAKIYNVDACGITDTAPSNTMSRGTVQIGNKGTYGEVHPDSVYNVRLSNIVCNSRGAVIVAGYLSDSEITDVTNNNPSCEAIAVHREDGLKNVRTSNIKTLSKE